MNGSIGGISSVLGDLHRLKLGVGLGLVVGLAAETGGERLHGGGVAAEAEEGKDDEGQGFHRSSSYGLQDKHGLVGLSRVNVKEVINMAKKGKGGKKKGGCK